jgi:hypothetical protein
MIKNIVQNFFSCYYFRAVNLPDERGEFIFAKLIAVGNNRFDVVKGLSRPLKR